MNAKRWRLPLGLLSAVTVSLCIIYLLRVKHEPSKMIGVVEPAPDSSKIASKSQPAAAVEESETAPAGEGETFDPILIEQKRRWASGSIGIMFGFFTSDVAKPKHRHHHHPNPSPAPNPPANSPPDASDGPTLVQTLSSSVNPIMELASAPLPDAGTFTPPTFESMLPIIPLSRPSLPTIANNSPVSVINQIVAPEINTTAALTNSVVGAPVQSLGHNAQSLTAAATSASSGLLQAPTRLLTSQPLGSILPTSSISSLSSSLRPTTSLLSATSLPSAVSSSLSGASSLAQTAVDSVTSPLSLIASKDSGTLTQASALLAHNSPVILLSQQSADTIANDSPASVISRMVHPETTAVTTTAANNSPGARLQNLIRDAQSISITPTSPGSGASRAQMQSFNSRLLGSISSPPSISSSSSSHRPTASSPSAPTSSLGGAASQAHGAIRSVSSGRH